MFHTVCYVYLTCLGDHYPVLVSPYLLVLMLPIMHFNFSAQTEVVLKGFIFKKGLIKATVMRLFQVRTIH